MRTLFASVPPRTEVERNWPIKPDFPTLPQVTKMTDRESILTLGAATSYLVGVNRGLQSHNSIEPNLRNGFLDMKRIIWAPVAMSLALHIGCGGGETTNAPASTPAASPAAPATPAASEAPAGTTSNAASISAGVASTVNPQDSSDAKEVVRALLDGMRSGNGENLEALFSTNARNEFARQEIGVQPVGSSEAVFEIQDATYQNDAMIVSTKLIEPPAEAGAEATETEILWELRKETAGWRICAMAADLGDGGELEVVNFESMGSHLQAPAAGTNGAPATAAPESRVAALPGSTDAANGPALPPVQSQSIEGQSTLPALPPANQLR